MERISLFTITLFALLSFAACKNDDPEDHDHEEELITTLNLVLTPSDGSEVVTLSFVDEDGDGGNEPVITTDNLAANTTYSGTITLLNESESPAEDITEEIDEEAEDHQFFFTTSNDLDATIAYEDTDADGNPVGLETTMTTGDASTGTLTVILRHEPNKDGNDVSDGDITNAGGETDIEVSFPVTIE